MKLRMMSTLTHHKDLAVWKKSIAVAGKVYAATRHLPSEERRGLAREMRRAALSIPGTVAAGAARRNRSEFIRFLHVARGSLCEVETQMTIAVDQRLLPPAMAPLEELAELGRLLDELIRSSTRSPQAAHARACAPHVPPTAPR